MDWYLPSDDPAALSALRRQVRSYLERHAEAGSDVAGAELVVGELLANALEHATGPVWVSLTWLAEQPDLAVYDLGPGFALPAGGAAPAQPATPYPRDSPDLLAEGGRGLVLVSHLAHALEVAARRGGGSRVAVRLPVARAPSRSIDPPRPATGALPALEEADASGEFGREAFLRALVVQLAQAIEHTGGPDVGEDVVAQVGTAIGGQMEASYRAAERIVGRLTSEQLADCFVRLKHAIEGGFHVVEVSDERIVLGNVRCPFGAAVRMSPALCRITSSVFGGIAARNRPAGAAVVLEERIAVGDPGCRVVVHLGEPPEATRRFAHRYLNPATQPVS